MEKIRVVILGRCPTLQLGIQTVFHDCETVTVTGGAGEAPEVAHLLETLTPDVLIVCSLTPDSQTAALAHSLLQQPGGPGLLVFGRVDDLTTVREMLETGVLGYVGMDEQPEVLAEAVRAVARGERWVSPALAARLVEDHVTVPPKLTSQEEAVLHLLAAGKTNGEIASELAVAKRTVRYHLEKLYRKLKLRNRNEAIIWAVRQGYGQNPG